MRPPPARRPPGYLAGDEAIVPWAAWTVLAVAVTVAAALIAVIYVAVT